MPDLETATHEKRDLNPRAVVWFAVGLIVTVVLVFIGIGVFEKVLGPPHMALRQELVTPSVSFPAPRLQAAEARDLAEFRTAEEEKLRSYGWVDRPAGVVRLPIDRAMDLIVERGLPARAPAKGGAP